jgi:hypothetical protein
MVIVATVGGGAVPHADRRAVSVVKGTPAAGVTRPIIDSCDNLPHVGDRQRWRPVSKQVLPWRLQKLAAVYDPLQKPRSQPQQAGQR